MRLVRKKHADELNNGSHRSVLTRTATPKRHEYTAVPQDSPETFGSDDVVRRLQKTLDWNTDKRRHSELMWQISSQVKL